MIYRPLDHRPHVFQLYYEQLVVHIIIDVTSEILFQKSLKKKLKLWMSHKNLTTVDKVVVETFSTNLILIE